jgi:hypothetical protein
METYDFMQELFNDMYRRLNGPCMNGECTQEELDQAVQDLYQEIYGNGNTN